MCQVKPKLSKPALTLLIRTVLLCPFSKCIRLTLLKASRGKTAFSLMPLFWTGFRLITMGMAKNGVLKQFFSFFAHAHEPFLLANFFLFFSSSVFLTFPFFSIFSFAAHYIVFLLHGIVAGQLLRKGTNLIYKEQSQVNRAIAIGFSSKCYLVLYL